jgi:hypothetical protein
MFRHFSTLRMATLLPLTLVPLTLFAAPLYPQTAWFIDVNAAPPGIGTQSAPYSSIQYAISQPSTVSGDALLTSPGTYFENVDFLGKDVLLFGVQGAANTIIDGGSNDSCVVFANGEGPGARLIGFTLTDGYDHWDPSATQHGGGGVFCFGASPTIRDCVFSANVHYGFGGGLYAESSSLALVNCVFDHNDADIYGGGAFFMNASPKLLECTFDSNTSQYADGGGAAVVGGTASFRKCRFLHNRTLDGSGAGLSLWGTASTVIVLDCTFESNDSTYNDHDGGGLYAFNANANVLGSRFANNSGGRGGGAWVLGPTSFTNCMFLSNRALPSSGGAVTGVGGGLYASPGVTASRCLFAYNEARGFGSVTAVGAGAYGATLSGCTIAGNKLTGSPLGSGSGAASSTLHDCIVWSNTPMALSVSNGTPATYCDIETPVAGTGNTSMDPQFCAAAFENFRLLSTSPCIDSGDPLDPLDPDGTVADVGLYPFDHNAPPVTSTYCTAKTNSAGCLPAIVLTGTPSASSGMPFVIGAQLVINNKTGLLFYGSQPSTTPFQAGLLCVKSPVHRAVVNNSGGNAGPNDCSGAFAFDFNAYAASGADPSLAGNVSVYAQYWYSDPSIFGGTGLTNAVAFTIQL